MKSYLKVLIVVILTGITCLGVRAGTMLTKGAAGIAAGHYSRNRVAYRDAGASGEEVQWDFSGFDFSGPGHKVVCEGDTLGRYRVTGDRMTATHTAELVGLHHRFYIKDHLGNNRRVMDMDGNVLQQTDYYPFGTPHADNASCTSADLQPYKYNGKELDGVHGLNTLDYGARQYHAAIPRWDRVDQLCEKYYHASPYAYCLNNPVNAIDPDGEMIVFVNGLIAFGAPPAGKSYWHGTKSKFVQGAIKYFKDRHVLFTEKNYGMLSTAQERRYAGFEYAKDNYNQWKKNMQEDETFKLVSHSMGAAFAMGIEDYIKSQGDRVDFNIMINAYQIDGIKNVKGSETIHVDYKNTNDPVLRLCDIDPYVSKNLMNASLRIREKSNNNFFDKHTSPLQNGRIWKLLKYLFDKNSRIEK